MNDHLYFRQLKSGVDFAQGDPLAGQMANFVYLIGDRQTGECLVVDPAYGVNDLVALAQRDGMTVTGVLATHYHPDHVGGSMMGYQIEGIAKLLELGDMPIHVNRHEKPWVEKTTGVSGDNLRAHEGGDSITVGKVSVTFVHTPGHTPGSQCFLVDGCLIAGDTLFLDGCGRTDLPGSDPALMYESLTMLNELPSNTKIFPGHHYSAPTSETLEQIRQHNFVLKPMNREQWLSIFS